jgi:hypothetical protein
VLEVKKVDNKEFSKLLEAWTKKFAIQIISNSTSLLNLAPLGGVVV